MLKDPPSGDSPLPAAPPALSARAARTRAALLKAGLELLAHRPVDAIAIDELVAAAGVAKGSFFNHFESKERFAAAVVRAVRLEVEALVSQVNAGISEPIERLAGGMIAAAAYAGANPDRTRILVGAYRGLALTDHPVNLGLLSDLRAAVAQGLVRLPSEEAGMLFWLGSCQVVMGSIIERAPGSRSAEDLLLDMLTMGLRALGAPEAEVAASAARDHVRARAARLAA